MNYSRVKLVVFVPVTHADIVREVLGNTGAGTIGNYDFCSFSSIGTGRFRGNEHSNPTIGQAGIIEQVNEERIEVVVEQSKISEVIAAMKNVHPYEEVAYDVYSLLDL